MMRASARIVLACVGLMLQSAAAAQSQPSKGFVLVDPERGTVDGVLLHAPLVAIRNSVGEKRVRAGSLSLEGIEKREVYDVFFGSRSARWWSERLFSFTDPGFKTRTGLRVGSRRRDFESLCGKGIDSYDEGPMVDFRPKCRIQVRVEDTDKRAPADRMVLEIQVQKPPATRAILEVH